MLLFSRSKHVLAAVQWILYTYGLARLVIVQFYSLDNSAVIQNFNLLQS